MPINGTVAEILDRTTLVANVGADDGVEEGMKFEVYEDGPMITDPETGEELGRPETVKTTVVASDVKENMTLMNTTTYTAPNLGGLVGALSQGSLTGGTTRQRKLNTDEARWEDRKKVRVGDSIRQVIESGREQAEEAESEEVEIGVDEAVEATLADEEEGGEGE